MTARIQHGDSLALIYGTRDNYIGEFQPPVADIREPAKLIHLRQSGDHLLIAINDGGKVSTFIVDKLDSPGMELLSALDRGRAQSALAAMQRDATEVSDAR